MRKKLAALLAALLLIGVPVGALLFARGREAAEGPEPEAVPELLQDSAPAAADTVDGQCLLTVKLGDELCQMDMETYLCGVLAAEMPVSFAFDALRAQAVAARTYTLYKVRFGSTSHPEADVCDDPACCEAYLSPDALRESWGADFEANCARVRSAVNDTDGVVLTYDDAPILAVFHAASGGRTADSGEVWGRSLPYLVSVESPETGEDVPDFFAETQVTAEAFAAAVRERYPAADLSGPPETWIEILSVTESGRVESASLGGVTVTGAAVRSLFDLRSAMFTVSADPEGVTFTTAGYGHGVGLSQYGANVLAERGMRYDEILAAYYTGATLTKIVMDL